MEPLRRKTIVICVTGTVLLLSVAACHEVRTPSAPSGEGAPQASAPLPPATPGTTRYHVSGVVTDEAGLPLSDASVEVDYSPGDGFSDPPSTCSSFGTFCWLSVRTDGTGRYAVVFDAGSRPIYGASSGPVIIALHEPFQPDIQVLPMWPSSPITQNLRMRRSPTIGAGESIAVSVDPDSSLCSDLEDLFVFTSRCAILDVAVGQRGTLVVEARGEGGSVTPSMFWYTTGNYEGIPSRPAPGVVSIPVRSGIFRIMVGVPVGLPSQRFIVSTSLR